MTPAGEKEKMIMKQLLTDQHKGPKKRNLAGPLIISEAYILARHASHEYKACECSQKVTPVEQQNPTLTIQCTKLECKSVWPPLRQAVAEREVVPPWSRRRKWWCSDAATPASAAPGPTLPTQRACHQRAYSNQLRADAHADAADRQSSIRLWINSSARTAGAVPIRAPAPAVGFNQIFVKTHANETPKSDGVDKGVAKSIAEGQLVCIIVCVSVVESQVWFLTRTGTGWKSGSKRNV
ncbi:hypothetical protein FB451DRAFT_1373313 [Mycena latifolia]|nr:hypothetical protein FB451DRAFT_1373313 [Mycena latifolia]